MRKLTIFLSSLFVLNGTIFASIAHAAGSCQIINGGGQICNQQGNITVDKTVENPQNSVYSSSLLGKTYTFNQGENVNFHVTATNTTNKPQSNIDIVDMLPANLDYVSSDGTDNVNQGTVTFHVPSLAAREAKTFSLQTKVNTRVLPNNQSLDCIANTTSIQTTTFFFFTNIQSRNYAIFCIKSGQQIISKQPTTIPLPTGQGPGQTKGGKYVYPPTNSTTSPATGPDIFSVLMLFPLIFIGRKLQSITQTKT